MLIWLLVLADFATGAEVDAEAVAEADADGAASIEGLLFRLTAVEVVVIPAASIGVGVGVDSIAVTLDTPWVLSVMNVG